MTPHQLTYELVPSTLKIYTDSFTTELVNRENGHIFVLKLEGVQVNKFKFISIHQHFRHFIKSFIDSFKGDMFHVTIDEKYPLKKRYRATDALKGPIETAVYV